MARRTPEQYDWDKVSFDQRILTKHFTKQSSKDVAYIVIHHMVIKDRDVNDDDGLDTVYRVWQSRPASAHYGVDGKFIAQFVWDKDYAWATGNTAGNARGISIEHVNSTLDESGTANDYHVSDETWHNGAKLVAYLHKVYKMGRPVDGKTLRKHSSFSSTSCPGPYLGGKIWKDYVKEAQRVYDEIIDGKAPSAPKPSKAPSKPAPTKPSGKPAKFPLPDGHWYGVESNDDRNHSGFYAKDQAGIKRGQTKLKNRGWNIVADGLYGPNTAKIVKQFQKEKGLKVDGALGVKTWNALWTAPIT